MNFIMLYDFCVHLCAFPYTSLSIYIAYLSLTIFNVKLKPCLVKKNIPDKFRFRHSFLFELFYCDCLGFLTIKWASLMGGGHREQL